MDILPCKALYFVVVRGEIGGIAPSKHLLFIIDAVYLSIVNAFNDVVVLGLAG